MPRMKTTIRLLIAFFIAAVCLYFVERHSNSQSMRRHNSSKLYPRHFDEVNRVILTPNGKPKQEFRRGIDGWEIVSPVSSPASESAIQKMIDAFESAPLYDFITQEEVELRKLKDSHFGLESPIGTFEIYGPRTSSIIKIGSATISTNEVFARMDNESEVLVTTSQLTEFFKKPLEDFADRRLFKANVKASEVLLIEQLGMPSLRIQRTNDKLGWQITSPSEGAADWTEMDKYFDLLHSARINSFVYAGNNKQGSGEPLLTLKLYSSNSPFPATITIDGQHPDEPDTYLAHSDSGTEVTIDGRLVRAIAITDNDIRDKRIFPSGPTLNVSFFSITPATGSAISLNKNLNTDWTLLSPIRAFADQEQSSSLVNGLLNATANNYIPIEGLKKYSSALQGPVITIRTASTTNRLACTLICNNAAQTNAAIVVDNAKFAAILPISRLNDIFSAINDPRLLVGKKLAQISTNELRTISISKQGLPVENYIRLENMPWELGEDMATNIVINASAMSSFIATLADLDADEISAIIHSGEDIEKYKLSSPRLEIKLDYQDETVPSTILAFGATTPDGGSYATIRGESVIYEVSSEIFENLYQNLTEIKGETKAFDSQPLIPHTP